MIPIATPYTGALVAQHALRRYSQHNDKFDVKIIDKRDYLARVREIGAVFREVMGCYSMAMSAVQVGALMEDRAKVEIEVTAVLPATPMPAGLP
jgi:enamine deaminase RidA (YjgF/YER057c/UK114 family)